MRVSATYSYCLTFLDDLLLKFKEYQARFVELEKMRENKNLKHSK